MCTLTAAIGFILHTHRTSSLLSDVTVLSPGNGCRGNLRWASRWPRSTSLTHWSVCVILYDRVTSVHQQVWTSEHTDGLCAYSKFVTHALRWLWRFVSWRSPDCWRRSSGIHPLTYPGKNCRLSSFRILQSLIRTTRHLSANGIYEQRGDWLSAHQQFVTETNLKLHNKENRHLLLFICELLLRIYIFIRKQRVFIFGSKPETGSCKILIFLIEAEIHKYKNMRKCNIYSCYYYF